MAIRTPRYFQHVLVGATAALFAGSRFVPGYDSPAPLTAEAAAVVHPTVSTEYIAEAVSPATNLKSEAKTAVAAFPEIARGLSHSRALEDAFKSYFAYKAAHPGKVTKPYLYFVDYGLPSSRPRGYVFDMEALTVVDGPFMVAHGRGSAANPAGVPTRFSNAHGSAATSLGLYLAQETYGFSGKAGGRFYTSIGLRLKGLSAGYNDNARARGVVAHGAPYVTAKRAGRSEGCPAVEEFRARRILPMIANGGMVFLFAPQSEWLRNDPWIANGNARESDSTSVAG